MKKIVKILSTLVLMVVVVCTVIGTVSAATTTDYYGRTMLGKMKNGTTLQSAYDQIVESVDECATSVQFKKPVLEKQFSAVWDAYVGDNGGQFWLQGGFNYTYSGDYVTGLSISYTMSGKTLKKAQKSFAAEAKKILSGVNKKWSEFEKEKYIHDALAAKIRYDDGKNASDAYGALVNGVCVCEGYAEAFQYLLQQVGIQSFLVTGTGNGGPHKWNYVRIDNKYYQVDLTWDDQGDFAYYSYFNMTDKQMAATHIPYSCAIKLPKCTSTKANYFAVEGGKVKAPYKAATIGKLLKKGNGIAQLYVKDGVENFIAWIQNGTNFKSVLGKLGLKYAPAEFSSLGNVVVIQLDIPKITTQPKDVKVANGKTAKVTVKATGEGLKYTWYYKDAKSSKFKKTTTTSSKYSAKMSSKIDGRQVYCVIKDQYGNELKSETVTLSMQKTVKITTQPKSVTVAKNKTAKVTVKATGDGLKYTWYYLRKGATKYTKASSTKNVFSVKMATKWKNCKVYCVVKDKYGTTVKSNIVTLKMK